MPTSVGGSALEGAARIAGCADASNLRLRPMIATGPMAESSCLCNDCGGATLLNASPPRMRKAQDQTR